MNKPIPLWRQEKERKAAAKRAERECAKADNSFRTSVGLVFKDANGVEHISLQMCQRGPSGHEIAHAIVNVEDGVITGCYLGRLLKIREEAVRKLALIHFKKAWPK